MPQHAKPIRDAKAAYLAAVARVRSEEEAAQTRITYSKGWFTIFSANGSVTRCRRRQLLCYAEMLEPAPPTSVEEFQYDPTPDEPSVSPVLKGAGIATLVLITLGALVATVMLTKTADIWRWTCKWSFFLIIGRSLIYCRKMPNRDLPRTERLGDLEFRSRLSVS